MLLKGFIDCVSSRKIDSFSISRDLLGSLAGTIFRAITTYQY